LKRDIAETITYIQVSHGTFPEEDGTSLEAEFGRLLAMLQEVCKRVKGESASRWLSVAADETRASFQRYQTGYLDEGRKLLAEAERHIEQTFSAKTTNPRFIVDPSGTARDQGDTKPPTDCP
jgi:hypothetical protein